MKTTLTLLFGLLALTAGAQPFEIGHTTITFNDPNRTGGFGSGGGPGRQIQCELYYPADIAGTDVNVTNGEFPVITFGHGFAMVWDAYANIWEELVPKGYIMVFPRTEGGLSPSHDEFGEDLALVTTAVQGLNTDAASLFFNHVSDKSCIMGHSMGGGATMLGSANNTNITTIIGLAPAETNPSAEQAAANISVPALIFSADEDAVTPPATHHQPIYDNLGSNCKYFVNIVGGGHCYYANSNFNCDFGETTSGGNIAITRAEQQTIMFRYIIPWLELYLKGSCGNSNVFETDLGLDSDVTHQSACTIGFPSIVATVTENAGTLSADQSGATYQWLDCDANFAPISGANNQSFTPSQTGTYAVSISTTSCIDTSICYTVGTSGIVSESTINLSISPNPNDGSFVVQSDIDAVYRVIDAAGKTIQNGSIESGATEINNYLRPGVYYLEVRHDSGSIARKKFLVF
jgi:dienelactone hydrolase